MENNTLDLVLKHKWYNMVESGEKKEEYREIKPYWDTRLRGKIYGFVKFHKSYTKTTMTFKVKSIKTGIGKPEWGADEKLRYIITLGNRVE